MDRRIGIIIRSFFYTNTMSTCNELTQGKYEIISQKKTTRCCFGMDIVKTMLVKKHIRNKVIRKLSKSYARSYDYFTSIFRILHRTDKSCYDDKNNLNLKNRSLNK